MKNYTHTTTQDVNNASFDRAADDNRELFKLALKEALDAKFSTIEDEIKDVQLPPLSKRYKIGMNHIFRECTDGAFIPFPDEED